jgi:hypothetical protein
MEDSNYKEARSSDNSTWKRTYWIVFLVGISYVLTLGLFTYLFNNPL